MKLELPSTHSGLRFSLSMVMVLMVISSPIVMLINPALKAAPSTTDDYTSLTPSTIGQDGSDFTTQAALSLTKATQSNDIVSTKAVYDILFRTTTAGVIKTITLNFPAGFFMGSAVLLEATGIGTGTIVVSGSISTGQTITYTVTNAVNVPASTDIRLEIANINNAANPSSNYQVTITTKDSGGTTIDGPTATSAFAVQLITTADIASKAVTTSKLADNAVTAPKIADGAITSTKPAESYEKRIQLLDDAAGNALGWNPNGVTTFFTITASAVTGPGSFVSIQNQNCRVNGVGGLGFSLLCAVAPGENEFLDYLVTNVPLHVNE